MSEKLVHQPTIFTSQKSHQRREVAEGVTIERRRLLWLPALVAAIAGGRAQAQEFPPKTGAGGSLSVQTGPFDWDDFLKQSVPSAMELHRDASAQGQETYLQWLALMAARLRLASIPHAKVGRFETLDPAVYFGPSHLGKPFFIIEWRMEPGAILPPHCHPNASVCTLGIEGEARIRNFELVGQAPEFTSRKSFRVRETHNEIIAPGRINTLSARRDNIHTFTAGKTGARGMDISTYHGPDVGFSFLEIGGKPTDAESRIYEANWKP